MRACDALRLELCVCVVASYDEAPARRVQLPIGWLTRPMADYFLMDPSTRQLTRPTLSNVRNSYQVERIKEEGDKFYLLWPEPECTNVCFWYVPTRLRGQTRTPQWDEELGQVSYLEMILSGSSCHLKSHP